MPLTDMKKVRRGEFANKGKNRKIKRYKKIH